MRHKVVFALATVAMLIAYSPPASAEVLRLTSGASTVAIFDNAVGDVNPVVDAVTFVGSIGVWTINVTTGLAGLTSIDLNSVDVAAGAGDDLKLEFTATDYSKPGTLFAHIGGTSEALWVSFAAYADPGNNPFGTTIPIASKTFNAPAGSFAQNFPGVATPEAIAYSLTEVVTISGAVKGTTSFNADVQVVPEPVGSGALLGYFLITAFGIHRWRTRKD